MTKEEINQVLERRIKEGNEDGGSIFNRCLEEETTLVSNMGQKFIDRIKYMMQFTQKEVEHEGKGVMNR